jgi:hypothetical protein
MIAAAYHTDWAGLLWIPIGLGAMYLIGVVLVKKNDHQEKLWKKPPEELTKVDGLFVGRPSKEAREYWTDERRAEEALSYAAAEEKLARSYKEHMEGED